MPRFAFEKIVHSNLDNVFEIFSNFRHYQKLFSQHYPFVRTRSVRGNVSVVEEHLVLGGKELLIMTKHVSKPFVLHEVFVIGGDAKGSHIKEEFTKLEDATKVIVEVNLRFKGMLKISNMFGGNDLKEGYSHVLDDFVKISEN